MSPELNPLLQDRKGFSDCISLDRICRDDLGNLIEFLRTTPSHEKRERMRGIISKPLKKKWKKIIVIDVLETSSRIRVDQGTIPSEWFAHYLGIQIKRVGQRRSLLSVEIGSESSRVSIEAPGDCLDVFLPRELSSGEWKDYILNLDVEVSREGKEIVYFSGNFPMPYLLIST